MTLRDRNAAHNMVAKYTASFAADEASVIPTKQLTQKLRNGERVVLVDVRSPEEQRVSMLPNALTREAFEADLLPSLKEHHDPPLVVPYCTVGYRSGLYCRELVREHGLRNVRNGEGVIMWAFEDGRLVRPRREALEGCTPAGCLVGAGAAGASDEVVKEVHVYGKPWDCAPEGFSTVYFSRAQGASKCLSFVCRSRGAWCCGARCWLGAAARGCLARWRRASS